MAKQKIDNFDVRLLKSLEVFRFYRKINRKCNLFSTNRYKNTLYIGKDDEKHSEIVCFMENAVVRLNYIFSILMLL